MRWVLITLRNFTDHLCYIGSRTNHQAHEISNILAIQNDSSLKRKFGVGKLLLPVRRNTDFLHVLHFMSFKNSSFVLGLSDKEHLVESIFLEFNANSDLFWSSIFQFKPLAQFLFDEKNFYFLPLEMRILST